MYTKLFCRNTIICDPRQATYNEAEFTDTARMKLKRSEQLRQAIEEKIAIGEYAPGRRLDEVELAASFGVSRTPLREALIQLGSAGLLDVRPRRGAVVAEVDPRRLCEMFEVMAELEAMCGRLAARRITEPELASDLDRSRACDVDQRARGGLERHRFARTDVHRAGGAGLQRSPER